MADTVAAAMAEVRTDHRVSWDGLSCSCGLRAPYSGDGKTVRKMWNEHIDKALAAAARRVLGRPDG